jgi:hypothetical protein
LVPSARPSVFPRYSPCAEGQLTNYQLFLPQYQSTFHQHQRDATSSGNRQIQLLWPRRRTRRAPTDRAARFIDDRSHSVSGRFSISTTRGQHHVPSSTLSASCVTRASSGLPLQPTDLSALLTEQIAHLRPLMCLFSRPPELAHLDAKPIE